MVQITAPFSPKLGSIYTAEGRIMHERVDTGRSETRGDVLFNADLRREDRFFRRGFKLVVGCSL